MRWGFSKMIEKIAARHGIVPDCTGTSTQPVLVPILRNIFFVNKKNKMYGNRAGTGTYVICVVANSDVTNSELSMHHIIMDILLTPAYRT